MAVVAGNRTNSGVAGALALVMAFAPAAFAEPANTNQPQAQTTAVTAEQARAAEPTVQPAFQVASNVMPPTGAPVTLKFGSKFSSEIIASTVRVMNSLGCPTTAGTYPLSTSVVVETQGKSNRFSDPDDAAGWALNLCRPSNS